MATSFRKSKGPDHLAPGLGDIHRLEKKTDKTIPSFSKLSERVYIFREGLKYLKRPSTFFMLLTRERQRKVQDFFSNFVAFSKYSMNFKV